MGKFNLLTNGEDAMKRVVVVDWDGKALPPCGACREWMTHLMPDDYREIEVLPDCDSGRVATLGGLTPEWWI